MKPVPKALINLSLGLIASAAVIVLAQTAATPAPSAAPKPAPIAAATPPPPSTPFNRGIIFLDPAHGGVDSGSRITDSLVEKDVTLGFAFKLRSLLTARGFSVVMTRDSDDAIEPGTPSTPLTLDDRAGIANHQYPLACLLLHATASGNGVHLYSSELDPIATQPLDNPWLTAQAPWVSQSEQLEKSIGKALTRSSIAIVMSRASVRPEDSLTCPALVVELAPNGSDASSVDDAGYQQTIAEAIAGALLNWKTQAQPPDPSPTAAASPVSTGVKP